MQRLARQLLKPRVLHVEPLRLLIQRVHNYRRGTDLNGNGKAALQRITQQRLADAFPLSILVNRKSRKDDHRNGIRPPLHKTFRRSLSDDAPSTHRIVTSARSFHVDPYTAQWWHPGFASRSGETTYQATPPRTETQPDYPTSPTDVAGEESHQRPKLNSLPKEVSSAKSVPSREKSAGWASNSSTREKSSIPNAKSR